MWLPKSIQISLIVWAVESLTGITRTDRWRRVRYKGEAAPYEFPCVILTIVVKNCVLSPNPLYPSHHLHCPCWKLSGRLICDFIWGSSGECIKFESALYVVFGGHFQARDDSWKKAMIWSRLGSTLNYDHVTVFYPAPETRMCRLTNNHDESCRRMMLFSCCFSPAWR